LNSAIQFDRQGFLPSLVHDIILRRIALAIFEPSIAPPAKVLQNGRIDESPLTQTGFAKSFIASCVWKCAQ
jgi:hypothetical protein